MAKSGEEWREKKRKREIQIKENKQKIQKNKLKIQHFKTI